MLNHEDEANQLGNNILEQVRQGAPGELFNRLLYLLLTYHYESSLMNLLSSDTKFFNNAFFIYGDSLTREIEAENVAECLEILCIYGLVTPMDERFPQLDRLICERYNENIQLVSDSIKLLRSRFEHLNAPCFSS